MTRLSVAVAIAFVRRSLSSSFFSPLSPSLSFPKDVSNRAASDNGGKNGQPNVTKRGASALGARSVTLDSARPDDAGAAADANVNNFQAPAQAPVAPPPPQAQAAVPQQLNGYGGGNYDFTSYQYSGPADDIDERDADDPLCATSYVQDMYEHFRSKELSTSVRPVYMEEQQYINERMRSILVDWLVEVHLKFKLVPETLYLTVNIIDRYLSKTEVSRPKLQLVGVTALLIASKYEEIYPPELRDLVYICDRAYSKLEVRSRIVPFPLPRASWGSHLLAFLPFSQTDP